MNSLLRGFSAAAGARLSRSVGAAIEPLEQRALLTATVTFAAPVATANLLPGLPLPVGPFNVLSGDFNGDGQTDLAVSSDLKTNILFGNGTGGFYAGPALSEGSDLVADFNGDGKDDLLTGLGVVFGKSNGTFSSPVPGFVFPTIGEFVVSGDFNGDGKADLVFSGTRIASFPPPDELRFPPGWQTVTTELLGNGDGTFVTQPEEDGPVEDLPENDAEAQMVAGDFSGTGVAEFEPGTAVAGFTGGPLFAGDFNGDGRDEAVATQSFQLGGQLVGVADFNGDGRDDLLEAVSVPRSAPDSNGSKFQLALVVDLNEGNGTFSPDATLTSPDGNDLRFLAIGKAGGSGLPDVIAASAVGGNPVDVLTFANTTSANAPPRAPRVTAKIDSLGLKSVAIPGDHGKLRLTLTNQGTVTATDRIAVSLYLTPAGGPAFPRQLPTPKLDSIQLHLKPGGSMTVTSPFTLTPGANGGLFNFYTRMFVGTGTPSDVVRESISKVPQHIQLGFGNVGTRHNLPLTFTPPDLGEVTFRLDGPGTGTLDDVFLDHVTVAGTTAATRLTISERRGNLFDFGSLVVNGSLGLLDIQRKAPVHTTVNGNVGKLVVGVIPSPGSPEFGSLTVTGQVGSLSGSAVGGIMNLGGSKPMKIKIGTPAFGGNENQFTLQLTTTAPIDELNVKSADDTASFIAPSIRTLRSAGDFSANLTLQGPPIGGDVLGDVKIGGSAVFSASPDGFNSWITDGNIGSITIGKGVSQMRILAGLILGPNETPSTNSIPATIGRLRIGGAVSGTVIIAGMKENVPGYSPTNALLPGGAIGPITIGGSLSAGSRITADVLPPIVSIEGKKIATAGDPRFSL